MPPFTWGAASALLTAFSLLLGFSIFLRDRINADRAQVDLIGIWWEVDRELGLLDQPRVDNITTKLRVRNASELPVVVNYIAWEVRTRWFVPDFAQATEPQDSPHYPGVWSVEPGTPKQFYTGPIWVPPQVTDESEPFTVPLDENAPEHARQLYLSSEGAVCQVRWALLTDNAGRRWEVRSDRGRRARRIRWYSRHREFYPYDWKNWWWRQFVKVRTRLTEQEKANRVGRSRS